MIHISYYSVIRMQASVRRGEVLNIGVLIHDSIEHMTHLSLLPSSHPKIVALVATQMRPEVYDDLIDYFSEAVHQLETNGIDLFEKDSDKHPASQSIHFLKEQELITMSEPIPVRKKADHKSLLETLMSIYVN